MKSVFEKYLSNTPNKIQIQIFDLVGFQIQKIQIQIFVYLNTNTNTYLTPALIGVYVLNVCVLNFLRTHISFHGSLSIATKGFIIYFI